MKIKKTIDLLESLIKEPSKGLREDVFIFVSKITPIINVDLLIKDKNGRTLLTWRDDDFYPTGWHVPGGIVRYRETMADRIDAVAATELGTKVKFKKDPLAINEVIHPSRRARGHFISLLYECKLSGPLDKNLGYKNGIPRAGEWAWHDKCPDNLISVHEMYRKFI